MPHEMADFLSTNQQSLYWCSLMQMNIFVNYTILFTSTTFYVVWAQKTIVSGCQLTSPTPHTATVPLSNNRPCTEAMTTYKSAVAQLISKPGCLINIHHLCTRGPGVSCSSPGENSRASCLGTRGWSPGGGFPTHKFTESQNYTRFFNTYRRFIT